MPSTFVLSDIDVNAETVHNAELADMTAEAIRVCCRQLDLPTNKSKAENIKALVTAARQQGPPCPPQPMQTEDIALPGAMTRGRRSTISKLENERRKSKSVAFVDKADDQIRLARLQEQVAILDRKLSDAEDEKQEARKELEFIRRIRFNCCFCKEEFPCTDLAIPSSELIVENNQSHKCKDCGRFAVLVDGKLEA